MRLESTKYLFDIKQAASLLSNFTRGKSFADFEGDPMLRSAVERQFEIIGEALTELAKADQHRVPSAMSPGWLALAAGPPSRTTEIELRIHRPDTAEVIHIPSQAVDPR